MKNLFFAFITLISIASCTPTLEQQLAQYAESIDFSTMPLPQPVDTNSNVNEDIATLHQAAAAEVTAYGSLKLDPATQKQVVDKFWLRARVHQPAALENVKDPGRFQMLAQQIAKDVEQSIKNTGDYDKIEVIILVKNESGEAVERNYFFRLPDLLEVVG